MHSDWRPAFHLTDKVVVFRRLRHTAHLAVDHSQDKAECAHLWKRTGHLAGHRLADDSHPRPTGHIVRCERLGPNQTAGSPTFAQALHVVSELAASITLQRHTYRLQS